MKNHPMRKGLFLFGSSILLFVASGCTFNKGVIQQETMFAQAKQECGLDAIQYEGESGYTYHPGHPGEEGKPGILCFIDQDKFSYHLVDDYEPVIEKIKQSPDISIRSFARRLTETEESQASLLAE